jgi:hypothetical protein
MNSPEVPETSAVLLTASNKSGALVLGGPNSISESTFTSSAEGDTNIEDNVFGARAVDQMALELEVASKVDNINFSTPIEII